MNSNVILISLHHHEEINSVQKTFTKQVSSLCEVINDTGNPFKETSKDLLVLDSHDILDKGSVEVIANVRSLGKKQFEDFMKERIIERSSSLFMPIKLNRFSLFSNSKPKQRSKLKSQVVTLKQNCSLFSQLYVISQVREGNLDTFFCHENQDYPPSISQNGSLRFGQKSELINCLTDGIHVNQTEIPNVDF